MGELLMRCGSAPMLLEAWHTTEARLPVEPAPRPEVEAFRADILVQLERISRSLLDASWQPGPARRVELPKKDGRTRVLRVPCLADRVAERAVLAAITPVVDPTLHPDSFGSRPGLGVADAVAALQERVDDGEVWVASTDLTDCFDHISRRGCLRVLREILADSEVLEIISRVINRTRGPVGVAQGSPLSPLLVNTYLDQMDRDLWLDGVSPIRYLDDIVLTAPTRSDAEQQLKILAAAASDRGMELSTSKTFVSHARGGVPFLGRTIRSDSRPHTRPITDPSRVTVHIASRGSALRARGQYFLVTDGRAPTLRRAASRTRMVVCNDRVMISSAAIALATRSGVDIAVLDNATGGCAFVGSGTGRHQVRQAQSRTLGDSVLRLQIARSVVAGKIRNCEVLLSRSATRRAAVGTVVPARLKHARRQVDEAQTVSALLGVEGAAARIYFSALVSLLDPEWGFRGRNRRPPRDPVNAMLSYGYTVLAAESRRAVELAGFDPTLGFLHHAHRGRPALAFDLMEEFRALIVDSTILRMISIRSIRPEGFNSTSSGCRMTEPTRRTLITELERRFLTRVTHPITRKPGSYRECVSEQAIVLARVACSGRGPYTPMPWR